MKTDIIIRKGTISEVVTLSRQVAEFFQPYSEHTYEERLGGVNHLILVAEIEGEVVGFKVGYQRYDRDTFYSWMGAVLNAYRRKGVATKLAEAQENWAKNQGYLRIVFKTRNRLRNMIHFAIHREFLLVDLIKKGPVEEYRLVFEKKL